MVSAWAKRFNEDRLAHLHRLLKDGLHPRVVAYWTELPFDSVLHVAKTNGYKVDPKRMEFTPKTKALADARCGGACEDCGHELTDKREYHHIIECFYGGTNSVGNCAVLCPNCHSAITKRRTRDIAQSRRFERVNRGEPKRSRRKVKIQSRPMAGTKASGLKRCMNGKVVKRKNGEAR